MRLAFSFIIMTFVLTVYAKEPSSHNLLFSPYVDLTIHTQWDPETQSQAPLDLLTISQITDIKHYHLAFITDAGVCNPAWGGQADYAVSSGWGKNRLDTLRKNGIHYTISFGGASNNDISMRCTLSQLTAMYETIIRTYDPEGLDFDIENGTANIPSMMKALKTIQQAHPTLKLSVTLPVMPDGLTFIGKEVVRQARDSNIAFHVNIMAMDYGPSYGGDMGHYAIEAASNLFDFLKTIYPNKNDASLWEQIEITPMIGVNDTANEEFTLANVDYLRDFSNKKQLGGLSMWSLTRDNPCADKWASPTCSGKNLQDTAYEFTRRFLRPSLQE